MEVTFGLIILLTWMLLFRSKLIESKKFEFEKFEDPGGPWGRQPIILTEGGYSNILLALNNDVKESPAVIENIKTFLTRASNILSSKSDGVLYFREISVLVPSVWNLNHLYGRPRPNETYGTARIVLRDSSSQGSPPTVPFVLHPGGCGEEGAYMYLPENKILTADNESEQIFLNLWSNLRWGFQQRSILTSQEEPTYCSPNLTQWETLLSNTEDYQTSYQNRAESSSRNVTPVFRILRPTDTYSVVIIDARENMRERSKYERMIRMLQHYSWQYFPTLSRVGIVSINDTSLKVKPCVKIWEDLAFRWQLYQGLPKSPSGSSSLGKAVTLAIQVLTNSTKGYLRGSNVFIMSDGTDTISPTLSDVQHEVNSSGVTLISLPFSSDPSENIQLPNTIKEYENSSYNRMHRLEDTERVVHISSIDDFCIDLIMETETVPLVVDGSSHAHNILLRIHGYDVSKIDVLWNGSEGQIYGEEYYHGDEFPDLQTEVADFIFHLKVTGEFEVSITSNDTQCIDVDVYITGLAPTGGEIITDERVKLDVIFTNDLIDYAESRDGVPIYAVITKNEKPVVNASVIATVIDPLGNIMVIQMKDTGMGIDSAKEDGVYSILYSSFTLEGYYQLIIEVLKSSTCLINMQNLTSSHCEPMQPFTRYTSEVTLTVLGIPPNRISDLGIDSIIGRTVLITWTAPGQDLTHGNAKYYDMKYGETMEMLTDEFINAASVTNILSGSLSHPLSSGSLESINVSFSNIDHLDVIYVAVRAVDEHNNVADISNIVSIRFEAEVLSTATPAEDPTELSWNDVETTLTKTTTYVQETRKLEKDTATKIAVSIGKTESLDSFSYTDTDTTLIDSTTKAASDDGTVESIFPILATAIPDDPIELSRTELETTSAKTTTHVRETTKFEKDTATKITANIRTTESSDRFTYTNIDTTLVDSTTNAEIDDGTVESIFPLIHSTDKTTVVKTSKSEGELTEINYNPEGHGGSGEMNSFKPTTESSTLPNTEFQITLTESREIEPTVSNDEPTRETTERVALGLDMSTSKATVLNTTYKEKNDANGVTDSKTGYSVDIGSTDKSPAIKTTALIQHITDIGTTNSRMSGKLTSSVTQSKTTVNSLPNVQLSTSTKLKPMTTKRDVAIPTVHSVSKLTVDSAITVKNIDNNRFIDKTISPKTTHNHVTELKHTKEIDNNSFIEKAMEAISSDTFKAAVVTGGVVTLASVTGLFIVLKKRKNRSGVSHVEKKHAGDELEML